MTRDERCRLALSFGCVLFANGDSTENTVSEGERFARALGIGASLLPRWGELTLRTEPGAMASAYQAEANPAGVNMNRVAAARATLDAMESGALASDEAATRVAASASVPQASTALFAAAAAAAALALAVLFGVDRPAAAGAIFVSAGAGALLRRAVVRYSANLFVQPFVAALLAGVIGGAAVHYQISSSLRLVTVCPCMVLVPGPHVLNSALDFLDGRIHLGVARMTYAMLVVAAISIGLLLGLGAFGAGLPVDVGARAIPLWQDVVAAGVCVVAYSIFFSTPLSMLPWPVVVGSLAHGLRWIAMTTFGCGAVGGAFIACFVVGAALTPVARRRRTPFAAIGFASVVSMVPGVLLFRAASGFVQIADGAGADLTVIADTLSSGATAVMIIVAMGVGLVVPKLAIDRLMANPGKVRK
jgi:uncharacterized membrane protein YjjP (DUF1212 family)